MNRKPIFLLLSFVTFNLFVVGQQPIKVMKENIELSFLLNNEGSPVYSMTYKKQEIIKPSRLGFSLDVDSLFNTGFTIINTASKQVDETWQPV